MSSARRAQRVAARPAAARPATGSRRALVHPAGRRRGAQLGHGDALRPARHRCVGRPDTVDRLSLAAAKPEAHWYATPGGATATFVALGSAVPAGRDRCADPRPGVRRRGRGTPRARHSLLRTVPALGGLAHPGPSPDPSRGGPGVPLHLRFGRHVPIRQGDPPFWHARLAARVARGTDHIFSHATSRHPSPEPACGNRIDFLTSLDRVEPCSEAQLGLYTGAAAVSHQYFDSTLYNPAARARRSPRQAPVTPPVEVVK